MKKRFTFLTAALMLLVFMMPSMAGWGQTTATYSLTPNQESTGSSATSYITTLTEFTYEQVSWKMNQWNPSTLQIKCNQSSAASEFRFYNTSAIPGRITQVVITFSALTVSDASKLMFLGGTTEVSTTTGGTAGTWNSTDKTLTWTPGTSDNFTFFAFYQNGKAASGTNYLASTDAIVVTYETGGGSLEQSDLAITGAPVALSFDLYDNNSSQTVSYTTSSTGDVTVSGGAGYVTTSLNTGSKTVTVTPTAVTPSPQTITISQAADATYAAGSKTFTVSVTDSTPFEGVIFKATTDIGTSPIVKDGVSFACDNGVLNNGSEYRLYKNSTTTFSTTDEESKITKIEFTGVSGNPASGFASQVGWTTSGNDGTWAGNATSVSFTASGAQVRATEIKVWVTWAPSISADNVNIAYNTTAGSIAYTLNHGADGSSVTATKITGDWLTVGDVGDESVAFTCSANNTSIDRTATVRLTYSEDEDIKTVVTVTQAGAPTYTVTYDSNEGTGTMTDPNSPYMAGASVTLLSNEFTKSGYIFNDWSISPNVTVTNNQFTMPASNVTVTAQWTAKFITELSYTGTPTKTSYYDGEYFDPTGLTITASYSNADDENVTSSVEWTPSPLINGTTSVTGTYMGHNVVISDLTVTYEPGTVNDPYTVAEAIAFINTLGDATSTNDVYVSGIISQVDSYNSTYNSITYWISDDGTTTTQMEVYSGKGVGGASFSAVTDLAVGDIVIVKGKVKKYQTTPEFVSNNQLYSLKHTVTYHINNGSGSETQAVQVEHGTTHTVIAKPDEWTYPGNTKLFVQWNTQDDGEGDNYAPDASLTVNENTDLYAVWDNNVWIISYTTNGADEATTTNVIKGQTISGLLASPVQVVPAGYTFVGWSETEVTLGNTPTFVNNGDAISGNMSLLAVFAIKTESEQIADNYLTITNADFTNALSGSYSTETIVKTIGTTNYSIEVNACEQNSMCQMRDNATLSYVYVPTLPGNITNISTTECHNAGTGGYTGTIHIKNKKTRGNVDTDDITKSVLSNVTSFSINMTGNDKSFYLLTSAGLRIKDLTITYRAETIIVTYSSYCTSVSDATDAITGAISEGHLTTNGTIPSGTAVYINTPLTINSGVTLTVNGVLGNDSPANLIIEDGGQLICNNSVQATAKKSIIKANNWGTGSSDDGWYFIASPVNDDVSPATCDLITDSDNSNPTYDLYYLDGANNLWKNYRNEGFSISNGQGYLYASKNGNDKVAFAGAIQPSSEKEVDGLVAGKFNLVGNPYTCNAYVNQPYFTLSQVKDGVSNTTTATVQTTPILPCTGVVVKPEGASVTFTPVTEEEEELSSGMGNVEMVLAQNVVTRGESKTQTIDNAIVSFNEGNQLGKFYFGTQDANLYIPMDNEEYAIVSSSTQGEMPINFKAHRDGQYTITVNPQEVEMGYLHLIDNIGGMDIDLLATPSYTFNAKADDYESRFRLVFSANLVNADMNDDFAFFSNGLLVIANEGESILQVIDVNGRIVATESVNGTCSKAINVKAGVYVLRLINGENVKTQKIIVK